MALRRWLTALWMLPAIAHGQGSIFPDSSRVAFTFNAGRFEYDLSTSGQTIMAAARLERPLSRYAIAEGGVLFARPNDASGDAATMFVPELQVQFQLPLRVVLPYAGFGGGLAWVPGQERVFSRQSGGRAWDPTFSVSSGARVWVTSAVGFRAEVRHRWIGGEFSGSCTEWTVGLAVRDPR